MFLFFQNQRRITNKKIFIILFLIGISIYSNSLFNNFVWDDFGQLVQNRLTTSLLNIPTFFTGSTFSSTNSELIGMYYKPIMPILFTLLNTINIFEGSAFIFHFFQVILHIINAFLLYLIFSSFIKKSLSFFSSIIFLIHPIQVEAVTYISASQEVLFTFFGLSSLLLFIYQKVTIKTHSMVILLLLLSVLSKETGFLFIFLYLTYTMIYKRKHIYSTILNSLIIFIVYSILRFGIAHVFFNTEKLAPIMRASFDERVNTIPQIILYYFKSFFFPKDFAIAQHWVIKEITLSNFFIPIALIVCFLLVLCVLGIRIKRYNKETYKQFIFFSIWLFIGLSLHLQLFPLDMTVADRWFYFPMIGLLGFFTSPLNSEKFNFIHFNNRIIIGIVILSMTMLGIRTIIRNSNWKDQYTLFTHDVQINTTSYDLENNAGVAFLEKGQLDKAKYHLKRSVTLAPYVPTSWYNLGAVFDKEGNYLEAKKHYEKSISLGTVPKAYEDYAILTLKLEDPLSTKKFTQQAIKKLPNNSTLWLILAVSEYQLGNYTDSLKAINKSYTLSPNSSNLYVLNQIKHNLPLDVKFK